jgi:hypothetical protein
VTCALKILASHPGNIILIILLRIVAYLLKASTVEPEKQPLLANGSETTLVFRQQEESQGNRFSPQESARNSGDTVETVFYGGPCSGVIMTTGARIRQSGRESPFREHRSSGIASVRNRCQAN